MKLYEVAVGIAVAAIMLVFGLQIYLEITRKDEERVIEASPGVCEEYERDMPAYYEYPSQYKTPAEFINITDSLCLYRHWSTLNMIEPWFIFLHPEIEPKWLTLAYEIEKMEWIEDPNLNDENNEIRHAIHEKIHDAVFAEKFWQFVPTIRQHPSIEDELAESTQPYFEFKPYLWENYLFGSAPGYYSGKLEYRTEKDGEWKSLMDIDARIYQAEFIKYRPALKELGESDFVEIRMDDEYVRKLSATEIRIIRDMSEIFGDYHDSIPVVELGNDAG